MSVRIYLYLVFLLNLCLMSNGQNRFSKLFKEKFKSSYKINTITNQSFLGYNNLSVIEIKKAKINLISYYQIPAKEVDSFFIKEYQDYQYKQSCSLSNRDSLRFENFIYNDTFFIIKPCSACSDLFNNDCYTFKRKLIQFLKRNVILSISLKKNEN